MADVGRNEQPGQTAAAGAPVSAGRSWRASVARTLLVTGSVIAGAATLVVQATHSSGARRAVLTTVGLATSLASALVAMFARRTSVRFQAWVAVLTLAATGVAGLGVVRLLAGPSLVLAAAVVATALLLGRRAVVAMIGLVTVAFGVSAALAVSGVIERPAAADSAFDSLHPWVRTSFVAVGVLIVLGVILTHAVTWLERAVAEAEEASRLHAAAEVRRLEAERAAQDARRRELVGRLATTVAHDFNNALLVIQMASDLLRRPGVTAADISEASAAIAGAARDASGLTRQLLVLGRREGRQPRALSLAALATDYQPTLARVLPADIALVLERGGEPWVEADEIELHQVLLNLVVNARDAVHAGSRIIVRVRAETLADPAPTGPGWSGARAAGRWAVLEVEDDGSGMAPETAARAFEPFFTTKGETGTGLGLASVLAIAEQSGGRVELDSALGRGTRLAVWLPATAPGVVAAAPPAEARTRPLEGVQVILCDDEPSVLRLEARALGHAGAIVTRATDGDSALAAVAAAPEAHLLCTDAIMPGAPVSQVIAAFEARFPGRPVVVCSGHVAETLLQRGIEAGRYALLAKPFGPSDLVEVIVASLARAQGAPRG